MKKPCQNKGCTTSTGDLVCRGCGITDDEKAAWPGLDRVRQSIILTACAYRLKHYDEAVSLIKIERQLKIMNKGKQYGQTNKPEE